MRRDRPSRSAVQVSQVVVLLAKDPRYAALLPPGLAEATERLLVAAGSLKPRHLKLFAKPWYRRLTRRMERVVTPGHFLYLGLRKRAIHDEAVAAIEGGVRQVLVVGAGMDTLPLRLGAAHPGLAFVEVDHPASQRAKRRAVEQMGGAPPNLHFVPLDLRSEAPMDELLAACPAWDPEAPSFVVAEGLLMFLDEEAVASLFEAVHRATGPGSRFLFSSVRRGPDGRPDLGRRGGFLSRFAKLFGEPIISAWDEAELPAWLEARGFRRVGPPERFDLWARYLEPAGLGDEAKRGIEYLTLADRTEDREAT